MSRLRDLSSNKRRSSRKKKDNTRSSYIPSYTPDGKVIDPGRAAKKKAVLRTMIVVAGIFAFIYIPGMYMREPEPETFIASPDSTAIQMVNQLLRDSGNEDFDGDDVTNADETAAGSNPWKADTDNDGMSDYYEIYVSDTNPAEYNRDMVDIQQREDNRNGNSLASPYKIGNVVLWLMITHPNHMVPWWKPCMVIIFVIFPVTHSSPSMIPVMRIRLKTGYGHYLNTENARMLGK